MTMPARKPRVLVVDDEELNLQIIAKHLASMDLEIDTAVNGVIAWDMLSTGSKRYEVVLLDRMMPELTGMEVLRRMRDDRALQLVQVIMQTAKASNEDVADGLRAGANYYLTKPFDGEVLRVIVRNAIESYRNFSYLERKASKDQELCRMIRSAQFEFRSLEDAKLLAGRISRAFPSPEKTLVGLVELMINAVEHGNLGISYKEKSHYLREGRWLEAVQERLAMPEYRDRVATVTIRRNQVQISVEIEDQGEGFDWQPYMDFAPQRAHDIHGRGIAMANSTAFDTVAYSKGGRCVTASSALIGD